MTKYYIERDISLAKHYIERGITLAKYYSARDISLARNFMDRDIFEAKNYIDRDIYLTKMRLTKKNIERKKFKILLKFRKFHPKKTFKKLEEIQKNPCKTPKKVFKY